MIKKIINKFKHSAKAVDIFDQCIEDLFNTDSVQQMKEIKHHLNLTCLDHSLFVSYVSYRICKMLGWDSEAAARGGLLHDLFLYDWRKNETPEGWHGTIHPKVALENAEELISSEYDSDLSDLEKDMIVNHMWPITPKKPAYKESMIVCMVDKLCAAAEMTMIFHIIKFKSRFFRLAAA